MSAVISSSSDRKFCSAQSSASTRKDCSFSTKVGSPSTVAMTWGISSWSCSFVMLYFIFPTDFTDYTDGVFTLTFLASRFSSSVVGWMKGQSGWTPSQPLYLIII